MLDMRGNSMSFKDMVQLLPGRSVRSISSRWSLRGPRNQHGILKNAYPPWTVEEDRQLQIFHETSGKWKDFESCKLSVTRFQPLGDKLGTWTTIVVPAPTRAASVKKLLSYRAPRPHQHMVRSRAFWSITG